MYRIPLAPILTGALVAASLATPAFARTSVGSAAPAGARPMAVELEPGDSACATAVAAKPKHKGFGGFMKGLVKEHGVQALEVATGAGALTMMSKGLPSAAAANGVQAAAAQSRSSVMAQAASAGQTVGSSIDRPAAPPGCVAPAPTPASHAPGASDVGR